MKTKRIFVAAATLGIMSFVTSCSNEALDSASDTVMLEAEVSGIANTRAAIEGSTLPAGSEYGLYVFQDYKAVSGNIKMNANTTSTGYLLTNNSEVKVCAYYPYSEQGLEGEDLMTIYPGTTDYLHTVSSELYTKSNPKAKIEMHHALARVKFNVTVAADATGSYEVYFTELDNVYTKGSMRIGYYDGEVYGSYKSNGRVNIEPIKDYLKAGVAVSSEVLLLPQDLKYEAPKVLLDINGESKDISADIVNTTFDCRWESGKVYTYNITISEGARLSVSAATIEEWGEAEELEGVTANLQKIDANGHEYVDLGLPSGTLWATCNVGAKAPEEYGLYFAWGETEPKEYYDWKTYKWCNGSASQLTKYCTVSQYGTVDNKTVLEPEDDAAHVNWGGDWYMPTLEELEELDENCTCDYAIINNSVECVKVTSKINGNSISLPPTGYMYGSERGWITFYSSSTLDQSYPLCAYYLSAYDVNIYTTSKYDRSCGKVVRPVLRK